MFQEPAPVSVPRSNPRAQRVRLSALRALTLVGVLLTLALPALAAPGPTGEAALGVDDARVRAELVVDADRVAPGDRVRVGVLLTLDPGWHIYWENPGDSGAATQIAWNAPQGEVGPLRWPAPHVFREADGLLTTYGYKDEVLLHAEARVVPAASDAWNLEAQVRFVACLTACIPGRIELAHAVPVGETRTPAEVSVRQRFDLAASRVPQRPRALQANVAARAAKPTAVDEPVAVVLEISSCTEAGADCRPWILDTPYADQAFLPLEASDVGFSAQGLARAPQAGVDGDETRGFSLVLHAESFEGEQALDGMRLRGIVPLARADQAAHLAVDIPLVVDANEASAGTFDVIAALPSAPDEPKATEAPQPDSPSLAFALLLGLVGGLILNLMPCVLPVLAIKIFAVTQLAQAERGHAVRHGLAYLAGIVASMWALAAVVIALRSAGAAVGWGFQLQNPIFLAAICTILVVFAMNLFGAFEITLQPSGPDLGPAVGPPATSRSFFEGTLAVAVATPCTAPFLGTAVGFAFASSGLVIVAIFTAIGIGLAAPFVLVTVVPGWSRFVPRPGAWMLRVRQALAFALLATVMWLTWVAGRAAGVDTQSLLLAYLVVVAFLAWLFGIAQAAARTGWARSLAAATLAFVVGALAILPFDAAPPPDTRDRVADSGDGIAWVAFDPAAIARERAAGRPVFVDFTADWCITCKVNETVVLSQDAVRNELERWNYAVFKADWTRRDDRITRALGTWGRAGVPMYLVYPADPAKSPELLPELLTLDDTVEALAAAGREAGI
ncbi:MAG: thioredoxin family protein [Myxococcota bacterium]